MSNFLRSFQENVNNSPKAIMLAGGAGVGKSTVIKSISGMVKDFKVINADNHVENPDSPMHGKLAAASIHVRDKEIPDAINAKQNLIYDTTASNLKTSMPVINQWKESGYDIIMIMVYAHPIVSFLRNFKRERKIPAGSVISTWVKVYSLMDEYKRVFGDKFFLIASPASNEEEYNKVEEFEKAQDEGRLKEFFMDLISSGEFKSSFSKTNDDELSPEDLEKRMKSRDKAKETTEKNVDELVNVYKKIVDNLNPMEVGELPSELGKFI